MSEEKMDNEIKNLLLEKEEILLSASQNRAIPGGSINTPNAIYITNMRVIFKDPKWLGIKAQIIDVNYNDISNTRLNRGAFSTEIYLKARYHSDEIRLPAVGKDVASQVHAMIQKGIRGELPGQKITITNTNAELSFKKDKPEESSRYMEDLEKIIDWKQKDMITEEEFQNLKSSILKKLSKENNIVPITQLQTHRNDQQQPTGNNNYVESINADNDNGNFLIYENSRLGIKTLYPVDWKLYEKEYYPDHPDEQWSQVVGFSSSGEIKTHSKLENVVILVKNLPSPNMTLDIYADKQIKIYLSKKTSVHQSTAVTFAGNQARKVLYTDKKGYDTIEVWTIKDDKIYTIKCVSKPHDYSTYLPIFLKMIESFEIKK